MKIILKETVEALGESGDVVTVKAGYGRNYLIPKGLGVLANDTTIRMIQKMIEEQEIKDANTKKGLQLIADKLNSLKLKFLMKSGEDDKLFGSITTQMISMELMNQGYKVDKKHISLNEPIKVLGNYFADVDFGDDIKAKIKIKVIAEE
tara:strand:+ start:317 stop:763 length:447 start_codon:yes stop_codon:yes gene_type:complete